MMRQILTVITLAGLISLGYCQDNSAPEFDSNDGNLKDRLSDGILENTPIDTVIGTLKAFVPNNPTAVISYSVSTNAYLQVNATSGVVILKTQLDREASTLSGNTFLVAFTATFGELQTSDQVTVSVLDVNDNEPIFQNQPYFTTVPETTRVGSTVYTNISITDKDIGFFSDISLTCQQDAADAESVLACDTFSVTPVRLGEGNYRGIITLKKPLDFETIEGYIMTIKAVDNPSEAGDKLQFTASLNVVLYIGDEQDTPPLFLETPIIFDVFENTPIGTEIGIIKAQDGDKDGRRPIRIVNKDPHGDASDLFAINDAVELTSPIYGSSVTIRKDIDREALNSSVYTINVEAIELQNGVETNQTVTEVVTINILDVDDNAPTFTKSLYNVTMLEKTNANDVTVVPQLTMLVTDPDEASYGKFNLSILSESPTPGLFSISPTNGSRTAQVYLNVMQPEKLNYEDPAYRRLTVIVKATDSKNALKSGTATVIINLQDVNDNAPVFPQSNYSAQILESANVGDFVITITARDEDSGVNGALVYSLRGTGVEKFNIDSTTGRVTLKEKIDFDAGQTVFYLLFVAQDQGDPKRETSVPLRVDVRDVNDLPPVFTQTIYETSVNEEETNLLISITVQARDPEQGSVTYEIVAGNTADNAFKVDRFTGVLSLSRGIEYKETNGKGLFNLTVQAKDANINPMTSEAYVIVTINDKNNHGPIFNPSSYFAVIPEVTPFNTLIKRVSATDEDSGSNGQIVYSIWSGGLDAFRMDGNAVRLSNNAKLDIQVIGIYNITIHATDQGSPQQTASAMLTVNLTDSNNKSPLFTEQSYAGNIQEGLPPGSTVLTVTAIDPDSTSDVQYSIIQETITAKDSSGNVIQTYPFDYRQAFGVDQTTGLITTKTELQQADMAEIEFQVRARDINAEIPLVQTATASVLITVLGTSDGTPYFQPPWSVLNPSYSLQLFEGTPVGEIITTLVAKEGGTDNLISNYQKIAGTDLDNYFNVNRTNGEIRLNKDLDYDTLDDKILSFGVMAISSTGLSVTANIIIQIQDINDNMPVFQLPPGRESYIFDIREDRSFTNQIATIIAKDADSGSYSDIVYSLTGNGASSFVIYPTGALYVSNGTVLDYETTTVYKLTIHATDNPKATTSGNQASVPLIINILDVNDNKPVFYESSYNFSIVESNSIYSRVGTVSATDADSGVNKEITYSFIFNTTDSKNASNLFSIDQDTGVIQVKSSLAGQSARSPFNMIVQAKSITLYSYVNVVIFISSGQLDNGRPYWSFPRLGETVSLLEHSSNGTLVARAIAAVRTPGGVPIYSFLMDSTNPYFTKFKINSTSGEIIVIGDLDREDQAVYDLILVATDSLNSTLQSTRLLTIQLEDIDDQSPSFNNCPNKQYEVPQLVSITEGVPAGSYVFRAQACDLDAFPHNSVQYEIFAPENHQYCSSSVRSFFNVNSTTGVVRTTVVIDRELNPSFLVCVQATQLNSSGRRKRATLEEYIANLERRQDVLYLLVTVNDINDEGPKFPPIDTLKLYTYVYGLPDSDRVVQYVAHDPDAYPNNKIRYSITDIQDVFSSGQRPVFGAFTINHDTGEISVGFPSYKPFVGHYFKVTIKAEDYNNPLMMDTLTFMIYVGDAMFQVRVVVDRTDIDQTYVNKLVQDLQNAQPGYKFLPTQIRYHKTSSGSVASRTDVCMFVVQVNTVMDSYEGTNILKTSPIQTVLSNEKAVEPGPCEPATTGSLEGWSVYWWVLVAFAIFIFVVTCILMYVVWALYRNYKTYMKTRKLYLVQG